MAYNGNEMVRVAQSPGEVDATSDRAFANPLIYGSSLDCKIKKTPIGKLLEVTGHLEQINPGSKVKLKYIFFLYEDFLEFEEEPTLHITRAITPSAKGSSIRVIAGEVKNVKKEFPLDVIKEEENMGVLFAIFDASTDEVYTYAHWTSRGPHITRGIGKKYSPDKPIILEFDKDIDSSSFSEETILCVSSIGRTVKGSYNVSGNTCTFTPAKSLKKGNEYTFYLKGGEGGLKSQSGFELDDDIIYPFVAEESEEAIIEVDTEKLDFGKLNDSAEKTVVIKNIGNAKLTGKASTGMTWLTVDPIQINVDPGKALELTAKINPKGMDEGFYDCNIIISTNGGNSTIPVSFQYVPITSTLVINPEKLDFGEVTINKSKTMKLNLSADGVVKGIISVDEDWLKTSKTEFEFDNGEIEITVSPTKTGELSAEISIESNGGNFTIPVSVVCTGKSSIEIISETPNPTTDTQAELVIKMVPSNKRFNLYLNGVISHRDVETAANGEMRLYVDLVPGFNSFKVESIGTDEIVTAEVSVTRQIILQLWIGKTNFMINDETFQLDVAPTVSSPPLPSELKNNTYMPIRAVAEALGAKVGWVGAEKKVTLTQIKSDGSQNFIELWINKKIAKVNGVETTLNDAGTLYPAIISSRTMLPLRFVANNLGASVGWNGAEKKITLTFPK